MHRRPVPYPGPPHCQLGRHLKISNIEKSVSLDSYSMLYFHIQYKYKNTGSYNFNSPSDTSMYVPNVVGTGSYTTRTTNMYDKDFTISRTLKSGLTEIKVQPLPMLTWPYSHVLHTTADSTSVYCRCSIGQCAHVEEPKCVANLPVSQGWHVVAPGRIGFESQGMQSSRVKG